MSPFQLIIITAFSLIIVTVASRLPRFSVRKPVTTWMALAAALILGGISVLRLPVDLMPDTSYGTVTIFVGVRGGMPPPEIESLITKPIEETVSSATHLKNILSTSKKDRSVVSLEFEPGTNIDFAAMEVREKFQLIKNKLPPEIEKPVIAHYKESDSPIMILAMTGTHYTPEMLRKIVDEQLKERLTRVTGVANLEVSGGRERKILIELDQSRLQAYGLPIKRVIQMLGLSNVNLSAGDVEETRQKVMIRTVGEFNNVEEIGALGIMMTPSGSIIRLRDIAQVKDSYLEAESISRLNRNQTVTLYIQKESKANTVRAAQAVLDELEEFKKTLDPNIQITVVTNQATFIKESIQAVYASMFWGALLAVLILLVFLKDYRYTLIIAGVIPVAVMAAFALMYFADISLNVMTLSGLALGIGMLLDNSIVVLENTFTHRDQTPDTTPEAAAETSIQASSEMSRAIVSATLTHVVIFLPMVIVSHQMGLLYGGLAFTAIGSLLASLYVALSLVPMCTARVRDHKHVLDQWHLRGLLRKAAPTVEKVKTTYRAAAHRVGSLRLPPFRWKTAGIVLSLVLLADGVSLYFHKGAHISAWLFTFASLIFITIGIKALFSYRRSLEIVLAHRKTLFGAVSLLFAASLFVFVFRLDKEYIGSSEQNEFTIFVELATGAKLEISDEVVDTIEKKLAVLPEIKKVVKTVSSRVEGWSSKIYVNLQPQAQRKRSAAEIIKSLRVQMKEIEKRFKDYDAFVYFSEPQSGHEIFVDVYGYDYDTLAKVASQIAGVVSKIPGFTDVKLRYRPGRPEMKIIVDKQKAASFGLDVKEISEIVHAEMRGLRATRFHAKGAYEVETIARLQGSDRATLEHLKRLAIDTPSGDHVLLEQVAALEPGLSPSEIWRKNKNRMIQVSANIGSVSLGKAADEVKRTLRQVNYPKDYYAAIGGEYDEMISNERDFHFSLILSILLIFAVLAMMFESYMQPFLIMASVPLSAIGFVSILFLTNTPVTIGAMIGILMLGGIVVNNAIILVDVINRNHAEQKMPLVQAILSAGESRLRPIVMTTLTTILGLIPMALDRSEGAAMWAPMAVTVIGGLASSTIFTLFIVPSLYLSLEEGKTVLKEKWHLSKGGEIKWNTN